MVYGIFRKNSKPNKKGSMAVPYQSGFKNKKSAQTYKNKMNNAGIKGYKIVKLR